MRARIRPASAWRSLGWRVSGWRFAPEIHSLPRPAHRVKTMPFRCRAQRGAWAWAADLRKASHPLICPLRPTATTKWIGIECRTSLHPEAIAAGRSCAPIHLAATQARLGQRGCWLAGDGANHACAALLTTGFEPATNSKESRRLKLRTNWLADSMELAASRALAQRASSLLKRITFDSARREPISNPSKSRCLQPPSCRLHLAHR